MTHTSWKIPWENVTYGKVLKRTRFTQKNPCLHICSACVTTEFDHARQVGNAPIQREIGYLSDALFDWFCTFCV